MKPKKSPRPGDVVTVEQAKRAGFKPDIYDIEEKGAAVKHAIALTKAARGACTSIVVRNRDGETREQARGRPFTLWSRRTD